MTNVIPLFPSASAETAAPVTPGEGDSFDPSSIVWVTAKRDMNRLAEAIAVAGEVVLDLETTGLNEHQIARPSWPVPARVTMISLTLRHFEDYEGDPPTFIVALSHPDSPWRNSWRFILTRICRVIRETGKPIVGHNVKFDLRWLYAHTGIDLSYQLAWDTLLSSHLLDENSSGALKERAPATFGVRRWDDHDLSKPGAAEQVPLFDLGVYAARDTYWTWRLFRHHQRIMNVGEESDPSAWPLDDDQADLWRLGKLAAWCDMPKVGTLTAIEQRGIRLDLAWVREKITELETARDESWDQLVDRYEVASDSEPSLAPTSLWFRSWTEAAVAAGDLQIIATTKNNNPQWTKGVLNRLVRLGKPVAELLLTYRQTVKRLEYLRSWLELVSPDRKIHATYRAGTVVTGRLSSCVTADTLIDMPRDMVKYPEGVPITEVRPGDWVYAFDWNRELTLRQVEWVGQTGVKPTVVVTFRNSHGMTRQLRCTPDHLIRLRNGDYRPAGVLMRAWGDRDSADRRVMGMVRRGFDPDQGYLHFFPHSIARGNGMKGGGRSKEHRWIVEQMLGKRLSTKLDVHHRNGTKIDNTPTNLVDLTMSEHRTLGHDHARYGEDRETPETYLGPNDWRVISVEPGEVEPVWDMTVPEDHCFVANGIVVHNSTPNMQQVTSSLKPAFLPTAGFYLAEIDYSQIELRAAAFISRCEPMIEAYRAGADLHRMMAAQITGKRPEEVTKDERQQGKAGDFGLLYGMQAEGFRVYADDVYGVVLTEREAQRARQAFFDLWTGMDRWHQEVIARAHRDGQVVSPLGRIRRLPDLYSRNEARVMDAERKAINSPVQGFASDLMQLAAASIEGRLPDTTAVPDVRLIGTVHDSILIEVPADDWKRATARCMRRMIDLAPILSRLGCELDVPLGAEAAVGRRWGIKDIGVITG